MKASLRFVPSVLLLAAAGALGCAEDGNPNPLETDGGGGTAGGDGGTSYANGGPGTCQGTVKPTNAEFCGASACTTTLDCARSGQRPVEACCVLVGEPGKGKNDRFLTRSTDTKKYADPEGGPVDLSCFDPPYPPKPAAGSGTVTLTGIVEAFANGCDLVGVRVEVYTVKRTGDPATDGELDQLVGTPIETDATSEEELEDVKNCVDLRKNRRYSYPNVPMNTELVIKTSKVSQADSWATLYAYNVYVHADDPDYDATAGTYHRDVQALAEDDFATIPTVAMGRTINPGNGAVGGEVHDCRNIRVQNARVDVSSPRLALTYFNADEDDPLPDTARDQIGTGRTGLYSALDIAPGWIRVSATGLVQEGGSEALVSLGYFDARIFPNSVTSVTLRGLRPFQVP
ncbi:MAG: hypothetical protein IT376_22595 [Polyangiaceae bacterium]|nr:hypothetical protein [Polyangiaceae bacterium]